MFAVNCVRIKFVFDFFKEIDNKKALLSFLNAYADKEPLKTLETKEERCLSNYNASLCLYGSGYIMLCNTPFT